jgi:hypothetical protein
MVAWFSGPAEPVMRIVVCNSAGEYHNLRPGMPYVEYIASVVTVGELPAPPGARDAATQVEWGDLPLPRMSEGFKKHFPAASA